MHVHQNTIERTQALEMALASAILRTERYNPPPEMMNPFQAIELLAKFRDERSLLGLTAL